MWVAFVRCAASVWIDGPPHALVRYRRLRFGFLIFLWEWFFRNVVVGVEWIQ